MASVGYVARQSIPRPWTRRQVDIVRMSAVRQLKARYRGTFLGILWSLANPLLMTALYSVIFGTAFSSYYGHSVPRYVFSVFVAVVVVTFFAQATAETLASVVANGGLLNKIAVDPETFPVAAMVSNTFQQAITTFPIILAMTAFITHDPLRLLLAPFVLCGLVALVSGIGLALATAYVFFRDLSYLWGVVSFVFWMTSPVFYPAALVPERVRFWFDINPIGLAISSLREVALGHGAIDLPLIGKFLIIAAICLAAGHAIFRMKRHQFMDLL